MSTELKTIPFAGGEMLATLGPDGQPYVAVQRVCEELGVDHRSQLTKLRNKDWARVVIITTRRSDGKETDMSFIPARAVPMWAATINVSKVKVGLQPRLRAYQLEAAEVLARAFMPSAIPATARSGVLARLDATAEVMTAAMARLGALSDVAVDHEHRLRSLEARPVVQVVMATRVSDIRLMRTRFNARLREEVPALTEGFSAEEKNRFYAEMNGGLKRAFGERDGWDAAKFIEASRWLLANYGIDVTDISAPVDVKSRGDGS